MFESTGNGSYPTTVVMKSGYLNQPANQKEDVNTPPLWRELQMFEGSIERLEDQVKNLGIRITPLCSPHPTATGLIEKEAEGSAVTMRLREFRGRVEHQVSLLASMAGNLEI